MKTKYAIICHAKNHSAQNQVYTWLVNHVAASCTRPGTNRIFSYVIMHCHTASYHRLIMLLNIIHMDITRVIFISNCTSIQLKVTDNMIMTHRCGACGVGCKTRGTRVADLKTIVSLIGNCSLDTESFGNGLHSFTHNFTTSYNLEDIGLVITLNFA